MIYYFDKEEIHDLNTKEFGILIDRVRLKEKGIWSGTRR